MWFCVVLVCHILPYCDVLLWAFLRYVMLDYLQCIILCCPVTLRYVMLRYAMLCYVMLHCLISYYVVLLRCVALWYVILCHVTLRLNKQQYEYNIKIFCHRSSSLIPGSMPLPLCFLWDPSLGWPSTVGIHCPVSNCSDCFIESYSALLWCVMMCYDVLWCVMMCWFGIFLHYVILMLYYLISHLICCSVTLRYVMLCHFMSYYAMFK